MLSKIKYLIIFLLFSCVYLKLPEDISFKASFYSNIYANIGKYFLDENVYEIYKEMDLELIEYIVPNDFELKKYVENGSRFEIFERRDNLGEKKLIIVANGGSFLTPYKNFRRDFFLKEIALRFKDFDLLMVDYKVGVQHRYPSQNIDFINSYKAALKLGYKNTNIVFMGDSSGGNIVASSTLNLLHNKMILPKLVILLSPVLDISNSLDSRTRNIKKDILFGNFDKDNVDIKEFEILPYFMEEKNLKNEYISPIFANNLKGFPTTLIQVGSYEILEDDALIFYEKLLKVGVNAKLENYHGLFHVFQIMNIPESKNAIDSIIEFININMIDNKNNYSVEEINKIKFVHDMNKFSKEELKIIYEKSKYNLKKLEENERKMYKNSYRDYLNK